MATIKITHPWFLATFAIVVVGGAVTLRLATTAIPLSMVDAKRIFEANGFITYAIENELDGQDAVCLKMLISRRELSDRDMTNLSMSDPDNPRWSGRVCIIHIRPDSRIRQVSPVPEDVFGDFCLFGDRKLVRMVKALLASETLRD